MRLVLYINLFWSIHFFARQKLVMPKLPLMKFLWPSSAVNKSDVSIYFPWQNTHPFISWIRKWQDDQNRKVQLTITISPLGHFAKEKKKRKMNFRNTMQSLISRLAGRKHSAVWRNVSFVSEDLRQTYQQFPWQCNKTEK